MNTIHTAESLGILVKADLLTIATAFGIETEGKNKTELVAAILAAQEAASKDSDEEPGDGADEEESDDDADDSEEEEGEDDSEDDENEEGEEGEEGDDDADDEEEKEKEEEEDAVRRVVRTNLTHNGNTYTKGTFTDEIDEEVVAELDAKGFIEDFMPEKTPQALEKAVRRGKKKLVFIRNVIHNGTEYSVGDEANDLDEDLKVKFAKDGLIDTK